MGHPILMEYVYRVRVSVAPAGGHTDGIRWHVDPSRMQRVHLALSDLGTGKLEIWTRETLLVSVLATDPYLLNKSAGIQRRLVEDASVAIRSLENQI